VLVWSIRHGNLDPALNKPSTLRVMRLCARLSARVPDRILSVSRAAIGAHVAAGYAADQFVVIPNGIDCARFAPDAAARERLRAGWGIGAQTPLVGLFARRDPHKDHDGFVTAAASLHARRPDVRFVLAGAGIDTKNRSLCEALATAGLSYGDAESIGAPVVRLLGARDDMPALHTAIDLLASSSRGEAFPNVVAEAMSCETPCVVTDVGESADIVGRFGRVVPPGDPAALAGALDAMLALPTHELSALGLAARASIAERYSIDAIRDRHAALYRQLVGARG
jgi:glycosyltransferase involved in cell wall biosynthesis